MTRNKPLHCATSGTRATSGALRPGHRTTRRAALHAVACAATACAGAIAITRVSAPALGASAQTLPLQTCAVPGVERVRCGSYAVPENRAVPNGRKLDLHVVVLQAESADRARDALFILQGGPGQAASDLAAFYAGTFAGLRRHRDIVLLDQRGTGASHPLDCRLGGTRADPGPYLGDLFPIERVRECRAELERDADLTQYTTPIAMEDLEEVRSALGYDRVDLYGTSYGVRAALVYARAHPERVRAMILKGVVPMTGILPRDFAVDAQRALDLLFDDCAADRACAGAYSTLRADFAKVLEALRKGSVNVDVEVRGAEVPRKYPLEAGPFGAFMRTLLQSTDTSKDLPLIIHDASNGNWLPYTRLAIEIREAAARGVQSGMFLSVTCTEDAPLLGDAPRAPDTFLEDYWIRSVVAACREWPRGSVPTDYRNPVRSEAPTLLVSGYLDSAAPPRWAEDAARTLPNSRHLVVRYGSHSFSGLAGCVDGLMTQFIEQASARDLDESCIARIKRPPFTLPHDLAQEKS
jgi:pimeloyl-ACP methyl ester carboxylesterase